MNTSKLKALLIPACCFVVTLCSEIKSMDTASDIQGTTSYKVKNTNSEGCLDILKAEIGSDSSRLLNQDENKNTETSWASYMSYPVKAVISGTYNVVDFTVKHPTSAIITSLLIAAQFTAVAANCNCLLRWCNPNLGGCTDMYVGWVANETECMNYYDNPEFTYVYCDRWG